MKTEIKLKTQLQPNAATQPSSLTLQTFATVSLRSPASRPNDLREIDRCLDNVYTLFGDRAILLPVPADRAGRMTVACPDITWEQTRAVPYQSRLSRENIAVATAMADLFGIETSRRTLGEKDPLTLQFMQTRAFVVMLQSETPWAEVEALFLRTLALHREVLGPDHPETLRLIYELGVAYVFHEEPAKAEPFLLDNLDRARRVLGEKHPITMNLTSLAAGDFRMLNQLEKAEALALRTLELRRSALGEDHTMTAGSICILANIYVRQQRFDQAGLLTEQALALSRRLPLEKSAFLAGHLSDLGWAYLEQGDVARAANLCDLASQAMRRNPDSNPARSPQIITSLGAVRLAQQNYAEATTLLREGLSLTEKHDLDAGYRFYVMNLLGASLAGQKKYTDAEPLLLQSCQGLQQRQASLAPYLNAPRRITESLERLVQLYDDWGKPAQAAEWKQKLATFQQAAKVVVKKGPQPLRMPYAEGIIPNNRPRLRPASTKKLRVSN